MSAGYGYGRVSVGVFMRAALGNELADRYEEALARELDAVLPKPEVPACPCPNCGAATFEGCVCP